MSDPRTILSVVTEGDLRTYFSGKRWEGPGWKDGSFEGNVEVVRVKIRKEGLAYWVKVEATDDPSDSEEMSTEKPLKAIADFLGQDIPGGEHFERMSSFPDLLALAIHAAADAILGGGVGRRRAASMVRRLSAAPAVADSSPSFSEGPMSDLEAQARKKGWKAKLQGGPHGDPVLKIDISGVYEAEVSVDSVMYGYSFEVEGEPSVSEEGTTEDPIREFEKWTKDRDVRDAIKDAQAAVGQRKTVVEKDDFSGPKTVVAPEDRDRPVQHRRPPMEEPLS